MSINKNDCLDCGNLVKDHENSWICLKGNLISRDKNGIIEVLDNDCKDFKYEE